MTDASPSPQAGRRGLRAPRALPPPQRLLFQPLGLLRRLVCRLPGRLGAAEGPGTPLGGHGGWGGLGVPISGDRNTRLHRARCTGRGARLGPREASVHRAEDRGSQTLPPDNPPTPPVPASPLRRGRLLGPGAGRAGFLRLQRGEDAGVARGEQGLSVGVPDAPLLLRRSDHRWCPGASRTRRSAGHRK